MNYIFWFLLFLAFSANTIAAPSGADLLSACEDSIVNGFQTKKGMLCIWYVTPCDCDFGTKKSVPRVCLPENKPHEELAKEVIAGLHKRPRLKTETAELAAGIILSANTLVLIIPEKLMAGSTSSI